MKIEGIGGKITYVNSKLYTVPVLIGGRMKDIECYGLEVILATKTPTKASYKKMCEKFKVNPEDVKRPQKLDLLISMWCNNLHPHKLRNVGQMTLYDGPLGKVFGGRWSRLEFSDPTHDSVCTYIDI